MKEMEQYILYDYKEICCELINSSSGVSSSQDDTKNAEGTLNEGGIKDILSYFQDMVNDRKKGENVPVYIISSKKKELEPGDFRLYGDLGSNQMNQYIGSLYYKEDLEGQESQEYLFQIRSRFDESTNGHFSKYILSQTFGEGSYLFADSLFSEGSVDFLEQVLAMVFVNQIDKAYKKGIYRQYREHERNDSKVRGRIDVARHIRLNPLSSGNIAYTYRELTENNDVNRLILTTYKMLERKYPQLKEEILYRRQRNVIDYIEQMSRIMEPASKAEIRSILKKHTQKITQPFYYDWDSVRETAVRIQRHMGNFAGGNNRSEMFGVLVDMNDSWELYLENVFNQHSENSDYKLKTQGEDEISILWLCDAKEGERKLYPDFYWEDNTSEESEGGEQPYALVLDAKNKPVWGKVAACERHFSDSKTPNSDNRIRDDLYEVFSYMLALNCNVGGIVCPTSSEENDIQKRGPYNISEYTKGKTFCVLGLPVGSSEEDYEQYKKEMQDREKELANEVDNILEPNKT